MQKVNLLEYKSLFIADTPYQIYNSAQLVINKGIKGKSDIMVFPAFFDADKVIERLEESGLFNKVQLLKFHKQVGKCYWRTLYELFFSKRFVKKVLHIDTDLTQYSKVYYSHPSREYEAIAFASHCEEINAIEDGIGSYFGNIFYYQPSGLYKAARKVLHNYTINKQYLNCPEAYLGTEKNIEKITNRNNREVGNSLLKNVFNYNSEGVLKNYQYIYVNQPLGDIMKGYEQTEQLALQQLNLNHKTLIRLHPRETNRGLFQGYDIDDTNNMWELLCDYELSEKQVLISFFSTAQFTPKLLYDKEPTLVFLYKLFDMLDVKRKQRIEHFIKVIEAAYRNKDRIIIINSIEELAGLFETAWIRSISGN